MAQEGSAEAAAARAGAGDAIANGTVTAAASAAVAIPASRAVHRTARSIPSSIPSGPPPFLACRNPLQLFSPRYDALSGMSNADSAWGIRDNLRRMYSSLKGKHSGPGIGADMSREFVVL